MNQPGKGFVILSSIALLWNVLGLLAVFADVRISAAQLAALPAAEQAVAQARPGWSIVGSAVAVTAGVLGCAALLARRRWALPLLVVSLLGVVVQDIGLFGVARAASLMGPVPVVMQTLVLLIALGLVLLARRATQRGWLR